MSFLHRTNTGTVVYKRQRHFFDYRDAARILRSTLDDYTGDHPEDSYFCVFYAVQNLINRVYDAGSTVLDWGRKAGFRLPSHSELLLKLVDVMVLISRRWMESYGPISFSGKKAKGWVLPFNPFFPPEVIPEAKPEQTNDALAALIQAQGRIREYLEEVGYGEDEG